MNKYILVTFSSTNLNCSVNYRPYQYLRLLKNFYRTGI